MPITLMLKSSLDAVCERLVRARALRASQPTGAFTAKDIDAAKQAGRK